METESDFVFSICRLDKTDPLSSQKFGLKL
jgi:hypothetical protein